MKKLSALFEFHGLEKRKIVSLFFKIKQRGEHDMCQVSDLHQLSYLKVDIVLFQGKPNVVRKGQLIDGKVWITRQTYYQEIGRWKKQTSVLPITDRLLEEIQQIYRGKILVAERKTTRGKLIFTGKGYTPKI